MDKKTESIEEAHKRYNSAAHAMQTGVAYSIGLDGSEREPKHMRVGINSAMVNSHAVAELLIRKGVFTKDEYILQLADSMEMEVDRYKKYLKDKLGVEVELL